MGTNITIKGLCGLMGDTSLGEPYNRYAAVARLMMETFSLKCLDASFNNYVRDMTNTSWDGPAAGGGGYSPTEISHCCQKILQESNAVDPRTTISSIISSVRRPEYNTATRQVMCWDVVLVTT